MRRKDMYEEDPVGKTIREIYDDIDEREKDWEELKQFSDSSDTYEPDFWEEDANDLLSELGIDKKIDIKTVPTEKLDRIYDYYSAKENTVDEEGEIIPYDPIPFYHAGNGKPDSELYDLGHTLGSLGELGVYYILLLDINFSRGYWMGKFEKAVKEDNDNLILEVSKEMKVYDPENAEAELSSVVDKCFGGKQEFGDDEKGKAMI